MAVEPRRQRNHRPGTTNGAGNAGENGDTTSTVLGAGIDGATVTRDIGRCPLSSILLGQHIRHQEGGGMDLSNTTLGGRYLLGPVIGTGGIRRLRRDDEPWP